MSFGNNLNDGIYSQSEYFKLYVNFSTSASHPLPGDILNNLTFTVLCHLQFSNAMPQNCQYVSLFESFLGP